MTAKNRDVVLAYALAFVVALVFAVLILVSSEYYKKYVEKVHRNESYSFTSLAQEVKPIVVKPLPVKEEKIPVYAKYVFYAEGGSYITGRIFIKTDEKLKEIKFDGFSHVYTYSGKIPSNFISYITATGDFNKDLIMEVFIVNSITESKSFVGRWVLDERDESIEITLKEKP